MRVEDKVFGSFEIEDSALIDLINSEPVQRLKKVGQAGLLGELKDPKQFTRYDHSIGVMRVLQILGASREEQVAGLLHDVSHTAFSHTIDYVLGNPLTADFQDNNHDKYVQSTVIPTILGDHGLDEMCAMHPTKEKFPLLEQDAPLLCADRVDYTLRNAVHQSQEGVVSLCLDDLATHKNEIVFSSYSSAETFWKVYRFLQECIWAAPKKIAEAKILGNALKVALDTGELKKDDLYVHDEHVEQKLRSSKNSIIQDNLRLLEGFEIKENSKQPNLRLNAKFRYVNPGCVHGKNFLRVSQFLPDYDKYQHTASHNKKYTSAGLPVRVVPT